MSPPESAKAAEVPAALSTEQLNTLAKEVEKALLQGRADTLPPETVQAMFAIACRLYSAQVEAGEEYLPLPPQSRVTATDIMLAASGLLKSGNLQVFELGMWVSYTGR